jgi:hypothetical protein
MNCEPHGFGGGEVDDQLELRGPLDRQIGVVNCHGATRARMSAPARRITQRGQPLSADGRTAEAVVSPVGVRNPAP